MNLDPTFLNWYKKQKHCRPLTRSECENISFLLDNIRGINWMGDTMYLFRTVKDYARSITRERKRNFNVREKCKLIWMIITNKIN